MITYLVWNLEHGKMYLQPAHDGTFLFIPCDLANKDYQAVRAWLEEGNTAEEWNPEESAPTDKA